jgi:hypothetical protein
MTTTAKIWAAKDFETKLDADHTFPFYEDEWGDGFCGYGHQDKAEFARLVNEYDEVCGGDVDPEDAYTESDVSHRYAIPYPTDNELFTWRNGDADVTADTPGAFPITMISR